MGKAGGTNTTPPLILPNPTRCHLWRKPKLVSEDLAGVHFDVVETYSDDDHFMRRLVKCRRCGQLYFREFYEEIDWSDGNDPQYRTFIPVKTKSQAEAINRLSRFELMELSPQLRSDFPKEADSPTIYWIRKSV